MPETIKVRILVATDAKGRYSATGWEEMPTCVGDVDIELDALDEPVRYSWVEADVPLPAPEVNVKGTVADA